MLDSLEREAVALVMEAEEDLRAKRTIDEDYRALMRDLRKVFGADRLEAILWGVAVQQNAGKKS